MIFSIQILVPYFAYENNQLDKAIIKAGVAIIIIPIAAVANNNDAAMIESLKINSKENIKATLSLCLWL